MVRAALLAAGGLWPVFAAALQAEERPLQPADCSSDVSRDEVVTFFPTAAAWEATSGAWHVPIRGVIYEPEDDSLWRTALVAQVGRRVGLDAQADAESTALFRRRMRLFLVDNERREQVCVRIADRVWPAGVSTANGHFGETLQLVADPPQRDATLAYEAALGAGDERRFAGRVHLLAPRGWSVISDIDDTIKLTQAYDLQAALRHTFLRPFVPAAGMAEWYQALAARGCAFHYVSGSPWQLYQPLAEFMAERQFPAGTYDLRHFRLKDPSTLAAMVRSPRPAKTQAIVDLLTRFPDRCFLLIGDAGEEDPEIYADVARQFPEQVRGVLIRAAGDVSGWPQRVEALRPALGKTPCFLFAHPDDIRAAVDEMFE